MERKQILCRPAEVNGTKKNRCVIGTEKPHIQQKSRAKKQSLLGSQFVYMGVLSDDFATVYFREKLCYHKPAEKAQIQRC